MNPYTRLLPEHGGIENIYYPKLGISVTTCEHLYESIHVSVKVPTGTPTDFASVPWPFRMIFPNVGPYARAAIFHDQLYRQQTCSRRTADSIFLDIMTHDNVVWWQKWPIYAAVRFGGGYFWAKQARKNAKESQ